LRRPVLIRGKCHCGNIAFIAFDWPGEGDIPARACGCTFCTKHGGVWTSNPRGALRVTVKDPSLVSTYQFGTKTAEFHVCARCGIVPVVTSRIDDHLYAVVSVNAFEGMDSRLARRKRNWIADVEFE